MIEKLKGLRILVVEDDPLQAIAYIEVLADAGAEILGPFGSVGPALAALECEACQVAILDYALGDNTAVDLQVRLEHLGIPYLVVTGYPRVLVRRGGDQTIVVKPVSPELLCGLVAAKAHHLQIRELR